MVSPTLSGSELTDPQPDTQPKSGFTLVELLVVIVIIGILASIAVPTIGYALKTARESTISNDVNMLRIGIEKFKTEVGTYPIDFQIPQLVQSHVRTLSGRQRHRNIANFNAPTNQPYAWYWGKDSGNTTRRDISDNGNLLRHLPNPHFLSGLSEIQFRNPREIDPPEALVFLLSELSTSAEYPLGYRWVDKVQFPGPTQGQPGYDLIPNDSKRIYFEFPETQLTDLDNDGWLEFIPPAGEPAPYVYFDRRSYLIPQTVYDPHHRSNPSGNNAGVNTVYGVQFGAEGMCQPYYDRWVNWFPDIPIVTNQQKPQVDIPARFLGSDKFQLICAGLDGHYGLPYYINADLPQQLNPDGYTQGVVPVADRKSGYDAPSKNFSLSDEQRDNFASFATQGRLDKLLED